MDDAQAIELKAIELNSIIDETIAKGVTPVQGFYSDAVVLITGGSGFLGKHLIEKLFRSCKIKKIYVFLRDKKEKPAQDRLNDIFKDMLYDKLRATQPDFLKKVVALPGDIRKLRLGINEDVRKILINEVNIIVHGAATINFVEPLKVATLTNVQGTMEILALAKECNKLKSFVHVSTAYSHATHSRANGTIFEEFHDVPISPELLIELADKLDEGALVEITPTILRDWPNTYSFTKAVAEDVVRSAAGDFPICVVRPAIVLGAFREPPGWVDKSTINGPIGFMMGAGLGGLHTMYAEPKVNLQFVPVDAVNNAIFAAAKETNDRYQRGDKDIKIFTVGNARNKIDLETIHSLAVQELHKIATPRIVWYPYCKVTNSKLLYYLLFWLLHFIPGFFVDTVFFLTGRKPKVTRLFKRAYKMNAIYSFYLTNEWQFEDSNTYNLHKSLSEDDKIIYACDTGKENTLNDPVSYINVLSVGMRKYILNDGLQGTEYALKKQSVLKILNIIYLAGYTYVIWKLFLFLSSMLWSFVMLFFRTK